MSTGAREAEDLARFAVGGRALRNRRIRRALIARLLSERGDEGVDEEDEGATGEGGDEDRQLVRALVASRVLRRRRLRRLVLAKLIRERGEAEDEPDEDEDEYGEDGGDEGARLAHGARIAPSLGRRRGEDQSAEAGRLPGRKSVVSTPSVSNHLLTMPLPISGLF